MLHAAHEQLKVALALKRAHGRVSAVSLLSGSAPAQLQVLADEEPETAPGS